MDADLTRRGLIRAGGAGAAGLALFGCDGEDAKSAGRPEPVTKRKTAPTGAMNVVVVVIDSLRVDHVYGPRARTDALNALARDGLRFTRAYPEAMPTIPARRSIMEGHRVFPFRGWRPFKNLTKQPGWEPVGYRKRMWTEYLQEQGWTTGYVTDNPHIVTSAHDNFRRRFDRPELIYGQVPEARKGTNKVSKAELYKHLPPALRGTRAEPRMLEYLRSNPRGRSEEEFLAARVFRRGIDWLEWAQTRQPFALVVDTFDAHEPWDAPLNLIDLYTTPTTGGIEPIQPFATPAGKAANLGLSRALVRRMAHLYAAEVTLVDRWLGRFLDRLAQLGLDDNTLIVAISDHGVFLGEYGWVGKRYKEMHQALCHVPFLIRHPAGKAKGRASRYFASTHDVGPTVLSILGFERPDSMNGRDLSPLLDGKRVRPRSYFTACYTDHVNSRDSRWLLISDNQGRNKRLYDRRRDPGERRNVASSNPDQVRRLWSYIKKDAGNRRLPRFKVGGGG
ncbi:MAG TPA: sulfatase [Thermoleophilaceae bacterium]|nr:sulfatase [Thermoleophilaceae bacterium]